MLQIIDEKFYVIVINDKYRFYLPSVSNIYNTWTGRIKYFSVNQWFIYSKQRLFRRSIITVDEHGIKIGRRTNYLQSTAS